jgi:hypothetical protein
MSTPPNVAPALPVAVQTATMRACAICGAEVQGERTVTCSERCRAKRWRRQRDGAREARDAEVRGLLEAALRRLSGKGES